MRLADLPEAAAFGSLPTPAGVDVVAFDLPVGRLTAYCAAPDDEPRAVALLVPGYTGSKEDFREFLPLLRERGVAAVALSRRGQADSAAPSSPDEYTLGAEAADVVRVAEIVAGLTGGAPVHLLGHSLGGVIGAAAVVAASSAFASYTLLCSGPRGWRNRKFFEAGLAAGEGTLAIWRATNPAAAELSLDALDAAQRFLHDRFAATSALSVIGGAAILSDPVDLTPGLAATGIRALVAHGVDDAAWPIAWQREMAAGLRARYEVIAGAAHGPHLESPAVTADLLADFWT